MAEPWKNRFTARSPSGYRLHRRTAFHCQVCDAKCVAGNTLARYCSKQCYNKALWRRRRQKQALLRQQAKELFGG